MLAAAPMRRIRSPCGAGAASGHPVVEPPSTDMTHAAAYPLPSSGDSIASAQTSNFDRG